MTQYRTPRPTSKYYVPEEVYKTTVHYCRQYPLWKQELEADPDYDPFLKYKLVEREPVQYMIRLGVQGLRRILEDNRGFTKSSLVQQQLDEYNEANNPILGFIRDADVEADIINCPTRDVYRRYTVFCNENGFTPVGNRVFVRQINLVLGLTSRQIRNGNKRIQVFDKE